MNLPNATSFCLIIFISSIIRDFNFCIGQQEDNSTKPANCRNLNFTCGDGTSIGYPFWGNKRPDYCGIPDYHLDCENDEFTEIEIMSQKYRVLEINPVNRIMTIVRKDFMIDEDACPETFNTTTLNFTRFDYVQIGFVNLTISYGCSQPTPLPYNQEQKAPTNKFSCQTNITNITDAYYWGSDLKTEVIPDTELCVRNIDIPISKSYISRIIADPKSLNGVLRKGFDVIYGVDEVENIAECFKCFDSGGACAYNDSISRLSCYSLNAPNSSETRKMRLLSAKFRPAYAAGQNFNDSGGACAYNDSVSGLSCYSLNAPNSSGSRNTRSEKQVVVGIAAAVGGLLLTLFVLFMLKCCSRKIYSQEGSPLDMLWKVKSSKTNNQELEAFFRNCGSLVPIRLRYKDVRKITNSFKEKLGQGGYGDVFKGQLRDGRLVAVKVLNKSKSSDGEEFLNEVASISRTSHVNIVALLGFCFEKNKRALIYEFMPNGSLDKLIYSKNLLLQSGFEWERLYQIAVGIARGLEYLHRGCTTRILHFDIKPHNILLNEDFCPKIADFGLAKLCPGKESIISMLDTRGTIGYIAPEVFSRNFGGVSHKSDVYSYGMMILEMVGGRKNFDQKVGVDHSSQLYFPHWVYDRLNLEEGLGLHGVTTDETGEAARKMSIVGLWCIQTNPTSRPSMSKVLEMLEGIVTALEIPPKPFLSSPPRSPPSPMDSSTIST